MNVTKPANVSFHNVHPDKLVMQVCVVGTRRMGVPVMDSSSVLHWCIFLELADIESVRIDMSVGRDTDTGFLFVQGNNRPAIAEAVTMQSYTITTPCTVQQILSIIWANGRNLYRFDETGSGSRYWCATVLSDLEAQGVVAQRSRQSFEEFIEEQNTDNPSRFPLPPRMGTFFMLPSHPPANSTYSNTEFAVQGTVA